MLRSPTSREESVRARRRDAALPSCSAEPLPAKKHGGDSFAGALVEEVEAAGFDAFAGVPMPAQPKQRARAKPLDPDRRRRAREALQAEIEETRRSLDDADRRVREASRQRKKVVRRLASLEAKRDRSQRRD